ncbi:MAG: hypothetical protein OEV49_04905 [candidate division Zixibacteria bacterium]|nr:hypothetical protein [candidate division Zixibacteria bacterium]MDH3937248.1 hypothetical protein [candidate division Zixibacteria bacterium]MDH4033282.1 hypothetical protein [candidate division Zixibacteria bacterium]
MKRAAILLAGVALLYLLPSVALKAVYGPSYTFPPSEDYWQPDGADGWKAHGSPVGPPPSSPSVEVPMAWHYLPIFLPAVLLALFMFGPLSKKMHEPLPSEDESKTDAGDDDQKADG